MSNESSQSTESSSGRAIRPTQISPFPNGNVGIAWSDGSESFFSGFDLRCACGCAHCVDEMTGDPILRKEQVAQDVHMIRAHPVGNYGVSFVWSDGHDTGIYTFEKLRALDEESS